MSTWSQEIGPGHNFHEGKQWSYLNDILYYTACIDFISMFDTTSV